MTQNFNSTNAGDGTDFEHAALTLLRSQGWTPIAGKAVDGRKATSHGVDLDLIVANPEGVKHSVECKGTLSGAGRPGAQRTDTVKKAIADAWYLAGFSDTLPHILYASHLPTGGIGLDQLQAALDAGLFARVMSPSGEMKSRLNCTIERSGR